MSFLTNEPAKKAEINILTARETTDPWVVIPGVYIQGCVVDVKEMY